MTQFLKETGTGKSSMSRLFMAVVTIPATLCIVFVWAKVSWETNTLSPVPASVITFVGVLLAQKVANKFAEASKPS